MQRTYKLLSASKLTRTMHRSPVESARKEIFCGRAGGRSDARGGGTAGQGPARERISSRARPIPPSRRDMHKKWSGEQPHLHEYPFK